MWIVSSICDLHLIYIYPRTCATSPLNLLTRGSPSMRILGPTARSYTQPSGIILDVMKHLSDELTRWCACVNYFVFDTYLYLVAQHIITFAWHHHWCCSTSRAMSALGIFGLQPSWCFSCCAGPHHHIRFLQLARLRFTGILNLETWY